MHEHYQGILIPCQPSGKKQTYDTIMPVFKRQDIQKIFQQIDNGDVSPVYLVFGERYLCSEVAGDLVQHLLPQEQQRATNLKNIDGEQEDITHTLNSLRTYSLFSGRQVIRVMDSKLFYSKQVAKTLWDKAKQSFASKELNRAGRYLGQMLALADITLADWTTEDIADISANRWQSLFGFAKPQNISWVKEVVDAEEGSEAAARQKDKGEAADLFTNAFEAGIPAGNILILVAEAVDKRKRFYKYLNKHGVIIDLSVDTGSTSTARKDQEAVLKELVQKTLAGFKKKLDPQALPLLLERVGFHPVAVVMETEKLALYVGDAPTITVNDLNKVVGRTREEALYEFTEAFGSQKPADALRILHRLRENGVHPLVMVSGLRNYLEKLLLARSFQEQPRPSYSAGMSFPAFQKGYLAQLKESREDWPSRLAGHPYAIYNTFKQAENFPLDILKSGLSELLDAEYRLKSSAVPDYIVLENLLFGIFTSQGRKTH